MILASWEKYQMSKYNNLTEEYVDAVGDENAAEKEKILVENMHVIFLSIHLFVSA